MFTRLPLEIVSEIVEYSDEEDRRALCLASRSLMDILQERVYRNLWLREDEESGRAALAHASGPRRQFVRHVYYTPSDPRPFQDELHNASIKLSDSTRAMLRSLHSFPSLESFRLDLQKWDLHGYPRGPFYYSFEGPDTEANEPWRTLLNDSLLALCSSSGAFGTLEVYHLLPISEHPAYSALQTDEWRALLGHIKKLDIQLAEIPGEGASNMTINHQPFIARLEENFLAHLPNVEHVRLAGREDGCIGAYHSDEEEPVKWTSIGMPKIRVFELEWSRIDEEAARFVEGNLDTLERVHLKECFAYTRKSWRQLFGNIANADPHKLVEFEVLPAIPSTWDWSDSESSTMSETYAEGGNGSGNGDHNSHIEVPGGDTSVKYIDEIRFLPIEVNESYGDIHVIGRDWRGIDDDDLESRVVETLSMVSALVDRNRKAASLS